MHACNAARVESVPVPDVFRGQTVFERRRGGVRVDQTSEGNAVLRLVVWRAGGVYHRSGTAARGLGASGGQGGRRVPGETVKENIRNEIHTLWLSKQST